MRESRGQRNARSGAAEIDVLRQQILALADADCVRPEDEGLLLSALDAALQDMAAGDLPAARAGIGRFIVGAEGLIAAGVLAGREGHTPIATARALLTVLRG